jgi:hypothetical protein
MLVVETSFVSIIDYGGVMRRAKGFASLSAVCLLTFAVVAYGQGSFGGLTGYIADPTGAAVPDATVKVTNLGTGVAVAVTSTSDGVYLVPTLSPGRYRIGVSKPGFNIFTQAPVVISTATVSTLDVKLTVGAVTQTVNVTTSAAPLQTSSAEVGTVMPDKNMLDLPISLGGLATIGASGRRQIENFIFLTPGVTGNQWSKSIDGAPGFSQEILIDGIDTTSMGAPGFIAESSPPYEAVSEFKVQNALYPAEYGGGSGVENFTLKSGTNQYHGDLFEFLRNNKFDAAGFFGNSTPLSALRQNEYGGTFGGPVILPHYNGKDKTFFFFTYSGFQLRGGLPAGSLVTLPTAQERQGNFSDYPFPIYNPATTRPDGTGGFTRDPFPGNIIPSSMISPIAQRTMALLPATNLPGYFNNFVSQAHQPTSENNYSVKIDQVISNKQRIDGSFWWDDAATTIFGPFPGLLDPGLRVAPTMGGGFRINHMYSIAPNLLNHFAFGYTPVNPTWSDWLPDPHKGNQILQIPGIPSDATGFPNFNFSNLYQGFGNTGSQNIYDYFQDWSGVDDMAWITGRHQIKFGFEYRRRRMTVDDFRNEAGGFNFSNLSTSLPDSPNFSTWGNSFASLLLGQVDSATRTIPPGINYYTDNLFGLYGEDIIKATPKLTVTLGLRYEIPIYAKPDYGQFSSLSLTRPNPGAGNLPGALQFLGTGPGRTGTNTIFGPGDYLHALSPRVGVAYALNSKTVLRAGYGIFYDYINVGRLNSTSLWNSGFGFTPAFASTNGDITPAFNLNNGFPVTPVTLPDLNPALNNNGTATWVNGSSALPAEVQNWTFDVERDLPSHITLDAAYVGSHAIHTWTGMENINQVNPQFLSLGNTLLANINSPAAAAAGVLPPYPGFQGSVAQGLRPFPQYTTLYDTYQPTGYDNYDSLQIRLQKRFSNGLSFLGSYTWSKSLGVPGTDTFGDPFGGGGNGSLNTYNRSNMYAVSPLNIPQDFVFSWMYELPVGRGKRFLSNRGPVVNAIVGGWQFNSIETYTSGSPIGVGGGPFLPLFNGINNVPNWVSSNVRTSTGTGSFNPGVDRYLNINAFSQPAPFTFGNAPPILPNTRTPAFYDEDLSLFKKFYITEDKYLEFRAEGFNILNRVVFGGPSTDLNSPETFGTIGGQANTPRVIQLALKFIF